MTEPKEQFIVRCAAHLHLHFVYVGMCHVNFVNSGLKCVAVFGRCEMTVACVVMWYFALLAYTCTAMVLLVLRCVGGGQFGAACYTCCLVLQTARARELPFPPPSPSPAS